MMTKRPCSFSIGVIPSERSRIVIDVDGYNGLGDHVVCNAEKTENGAMVKAHFYTPHYAMPIREFAFALEDWNEDSSLEISGDAASASTVLVKGKNCSPAFQIHLSHDFDDEVLHMTEDPRVVVDLQDHQGKRLADWGYVMQRDILGEDAYTKKYRGEL